MLIGPTLVDIDTIIVRDITAIGVVYLDGNVVFGLASRPTAITLGSFLKQEDHILISLEFV